MKILEIKKLKKNYQVLFDNDEKLILDENTIVKYKLIPNKEVHDLSLFTESFEINKIYEKALKYALYGKSENQMIEYLYKEGIDDVTDIIQRLKNEHVINDYKMINALKRQEYSYLKLEQKLYYYKFDVQDINQALADYDDSNALRKEYMSLLKKFKNEPSDKKNQKIYRNLLSKGFRDDQVISILNINE